MRMNACSTGRPAGCRRWMRGIIADVSPQSESNGVVGVGVEELMARLRAGDIRALARAISIVEAGSPLAAELVKACRSFAGDALRVGVTGPPGVGKSTLVDQMARWLRSEGRSVGVVAVDPSSPYTGGALLGDRIRMESARLDPQVFIRSMATRGAHGGLATTTEEVADLLEAFGFER